MHRRPAAPSRSRRRAGGIAFCVLAACLVLAGPPPPASAVGVRYRDEVFASTSSTTNIVYDTVTNYDGGSLDVKLDVHQPVGDTETNRAAIIYVHGGYFAGGDKSEGTSTMQEAARHGYVTASINYRVWPGAASDGTKLLWGINAAQHDAQSAVRWLRRNASTFGVNPQAIFIMGYSAGAITALNVNYGSLAPEAGGNQGYASDTAGAVSLAGFSFGVTPHAAPVMMFHGTNDPVVQYAWGQSTCNSANDIGDSCVLHSYPGATHDLTPYFSDIKPKIYAFFYSLVPGVLALPAPLAGFHPVSPSRQLDTRSGVGTGGTIAPVTGGSPITLDLAGKAGIPSSGVSAVVVNVTAVGATAPTHVTVWPGGTPMPTTSNLNLVDGQTVANLVTTAVGPGVTLQLANHSGAVDLVADVVGWYDDGTIAGDRFNPIVPSRVLDTRVGLGGVNGRLVAGSPIDVAVGNTPGVPADAHAAVANLTAVGGTDESHLTAWPAGESAPGVSNLNFRAGQTVPNLATVKLGTAGKISLANNAGGVFALADVSGFYSSTGTRFVAVPPTRVLDTREGLGASAGPVAGGTSIDLFIKTASGLPPDGIAAVVINVTAVGASQSTHVTVWPSGSDMPTASNLNVSSGNAVPNLVSVGVGTNGKISLFNNAGTVQLVGDVVGYFA